MASVVVDERGLDPLNHYGLRSQGALLLFLTPLFFLPYYLCLLGVALRGALPHLLLGYSVE
jgi:hypothetical protein